MPVIPKPSTSDVEGFAFMRGNNDGRMPSRFWSHHDSHLVASTVLRFTARRNCARRNRRRYSYAHTLGSSLECGVVSSTKYFVFERGWCDVVEESRQPSLYPARTFPPTVHPHLRRLGRLSLLDGQDAVLPGIRTFWIGGHTVLPTHEPDLAASY